MIGQTTKLQGIPSIFAAASWMEAFRSAGKLQIGLGPNQVALLQSNWSGGPPPRTNADRGRDDPKLRLRGVSSGGKGRPEPSILGQFPE